MTEPAILYDNIIASGVTATDTATGFSVDSIYDLRGYTLWRANTFGTKYLTMDAGSAVPVDAIGFYGHNFYTSSATVTLEHSTTGAWAGEEISIAIPVTLVNDRPIYKSFDQVTVRYWRIKIVTAAIAPQVAVVILGSAMDFPCYPDVPFSYRNDTIQASTEKSKGGHLLGAVNYCTKLDATTSFTYPPMTFINGDYLTFWENHGRLKKPFFWVFNYSQYPTKILYTRLSDSSSFGVALGDTTNAESLSISMSGVLMRKEPI